MKARHKKAHKAHGGEVFYSGGESNVAKEANEKKRGGKVKAHKAMKAEGGSAMSRLDRKGRKTGGRVGADKSPLSSAHGSTSPERD